MRQAGVLAAAGIYALENNLDQLHVDHDNAMALAVGISGIEGMEVDLSTVQSNMVFVSMDPVRQAGLVAYLREKGIFAGGYGQLRLVTHLDVDAGDVATVVEAVRTFASQFS